LTWSAPAIGMQDWGLTGSVTMPRLQIEGAGGTASNGGNLVLMGVRAEGSTEPNGGDQVLQVSADPLDMGVNGAPVRASSELSERGYALHVSGAATLESLKAAAGVLHLPTLAEISVETELPVSGQPLQRQQAAAAHMALTTSGPWMASAAGSGGEASGTTGTLQLTNVEWSLPWLRSPVLLAAANAAFSPGYVRWSTTGASLGEAPNRIELSGSAQVPLQCSPGLDAGEPGETGGNAGDATENENGNGAAGTACAVQALLTVPVLPAAALQAALSGGQSPLLAALLQRFDSRAGGLRLPALAATVHVGLLQLGKLPVHNAAIELRTARSSVVVEGLDGQALGGRLHVTGTIGMKEGAPTYTVHALGTGMSALQAGALWQESWGPGTLGGSAELQLTGSDSEALLAHASGSFRASWEHGGLGKVLPRFASWDGSGTVGPGGLRLVEGTLSGTSATLTGTVGWDRGLALRLTEEPGAVTQGIDGTLAAPILQPVGQVGGQTGPAVVR
jgi:hypothetical protein